MGFLKRLADAFVTLSESWGDVASPGEAGVFGVLEFLDAYGYVTDGVTKGPADVAAAIRLLQSQAGLKVDAIPGPLTQAATRLPRCGVRENAVRGVGFWAKKGLRYAVVNYVDGIPIAEQDEIFAQGANAWSRVSAISLQKVDDVADADIVVSVSGDRREDFGRPNGVLAWAEIPPSNHWRDPLNLKLDDAELWRGRSGGGAGVRLLNVFTHELGHSLGLLHSQFPSALMAPFYDADVATPQAIDDVSRIVKLYGPNDDPVGSDDGLTYTVDADGALRLAGHTLTRKG